MMTSYTKRKEKVVLAICKSGRLDAIVSSLFESRHTKRLYVLSEVENRGLTSKAIVKKGRTDNCDEVAKFASEIKPDFVVIGPEEPLAAGVVNRLAAMGIPCVGPIKELAKIEWSKSFARQLLAEHEIDGNPEHKIFHTIAGIDEYLRDLGDFVIKPDGLTAGKGVQVSGEHIKTIDQAISYCRELFAGGQPAVIIEEKLEGEEFSFQSFCDGNHVVDTFPIQDHKRAGEGDTGPNTGGMGSYSCADHLLPFLSPKHIKAASEINSKVAAALNEKGLREFGVPYKGILYGGFMVTEKGLRLIEYNARFGDPEIMNVLPLAYSGEDDR